MRGRRLSAVSLAYVMLIASIAGTPLVLGTGTAAANTTADTTYAVGQSGQCKAEITPLGDGSQTGPDYYDYRGTDAGFYASHGTTDVQVSDASQLYVYDGSDGTSLVFLHDELGDEQNGGAITFDVSGLPTDGNWTVEDDNYDGRDDNFDHAGSESRIDWMWAGNRTDGAMFLGLESDGWSEITVDPAFGEESWAANERSPTWPHADEGPNEWQVRNESGDTTSLDMSERISFRAGGCTAVSPTAALSGPDDASTGEDVTLEASSPDSPTTPIEYRWDFEDDGVVDRTTTSTTVEHSYSTSGEVTAAVTVVDRFGQTATATENISIEESTTENEPPTVNLSAAPGVVTTGENVTLEADASDPDGDQLTYNWSQVSGPSGLDLPEGSNGTVTPTDAGTYEVRVTVEDSEGANASDTVTFEATDGNAPPSASFDWSPTDLAPSETITFDASDSSDPDGNVTSYAWDFDDDGVTDANGEQATHAFDSAGSYDVTLTVTDGDGANDTATETIEVEESAPSNRAPTVELSADPASVTVGENVTLQADATDPDGDPITYSWEQVDGPESLDLPSGENGSVTPSAAGTYEVRVIVEDSEGANASDTVTFEANEATTAPTAAFDWTPGTPETGREVTFDASNSTDEDGTVETFEWDFDDDGQFDASGETATWTFDSAGAHDVTLRVTDDDGATDTTTGTIQVGEPDSGENQPPKAVLSASDGTVEVGEAVTLDASGSSDPDGSDDALAFEWAVVSAPKGATLPTFDAASTNEVSFDDPGTYEVKVTVEDAGGATDSATETIEVTGEPRLHVHDVRIEDDTVEVDEKTEFHVTVHNDGSATGYKTLEVRLEGTVVESRTVEVAAGETATFTLIHCFERPGNYTAKVAGKPFDVRVSPPTHSLQNLSIDGDSTLDADSPGSVTASAKLVVETDVVSSGDWNESLDDLVAGAFDVSIGAADAPVTNVSAGDPERRGSKWVIPLALDVDAPSNDPGTYDLRVAVDLPHACWPLVDSDCEEGRSIALTGEDVVVYEASGSSSGGSGGGPSSGYGGSSPGSADGSSSDAGDDTAGQEDPTTSDADGRTASPTSTSGATSTSESTPAQAGTTQEPTASPVGTESPGQPGFGLVLAVLAILSAALLARLRN